MDIINYFESLSNKAIDSNDLEEAMQYFAFFLGAYRFAMEFNSFVNQAQEFKVAEIYEQLTKYMLDISENKELLN